MSQYLETILIVEDDPQIRNFMKYIIEREGYKFVIATCAKTALHYFVMEHIDLILLDLGLPDLDGLEVIQQIREWSQAPIIVVSARDQDRDKVMALDCGADDYLTKPFSATELLARIRVSIRHLQNKTMQSIQLNYKVAGLEIDYVKRLVYVDGVEVHMTPNEYSMLSIVSKHAGKVISSSSLLKEIWGYHYGNDTQVLRALVAGLRRKIEHIPAKPRYLLTEVGIGYRLVDE